MVLTKWESRPYFTAVWVWDNSAGAYINNTLEAHSKNGTAFSIFADANDYIYLGSQGKFDFAGFSLATVGVIGTPVQWDYWNGSAWTQLIQENNYTFALSGAEEFRHLEDWAAYAFSNSAPHSATPPDTQQRYWVRGTVASVTTAPTINQIYARQRAAYASPTDVSNLLAIPNDFSATTRPTRDTVEDYIWAAQDYIDKETRKSWRMHFKEDEEHDFLRSGFRLVESYPQEIAQLEIWTGSQYDTKTEGRTADYFLVKDTGMVHYARFFILPARIQAYSGSAWGYGWGEFTYPVRVSYFHGGDIHGHGPEGGIVWDITRKLAAIDVYTNHDYSILTVAGSDRVSLDRKIDGWKMEIEERLTRLERWETM